MEHNRETNPLSALDSQMALSVNAKRVLRYMFMWHDDIGKMSAQHMGSMMSLPGKYTSQWVEKALEELQSLGYVHQVKEGESWNNFQRGSWGICWGKFYQDFGYGNYIPKQLM